MTQQYRRMQDEYQNQIKELKREVEDKEDKLSKR